MLDVHQLSRSYGDFLAVDQVNFQVTQGEIVGLLGHNGAGKTTIMKMIAGYLEPHQGEIRFNALSMNNHAKTIQRSLGYLPENLPVYPEMHVIDYLDYMATLKQIPASHKPSELNRVIMATGLTEKACDPIATLSRGLKQRVGVAQAILGSPRLLILDEPTNGLDPAQTDQMRILIKTLAQSATVIMSTHIMQEVEAVCDRVLILDHGHLVVDETLKNLQQGNTIRVATSLPPEVIQPLLKPVAGIQEIHTIATEVTPTYQLTLSHTDPAAIQRISHQVASIILHHQGLLFLLQPERQNLESRFREVTSATLASAAAVIPEK